MRIGTAVAGLAVVLAGVWAAIEGYVAAIIGTAGAILGGVLGAWFQSYRTGDLARRLRREERQDEALYELLDYLSRVEQVLNAFFAAHAVDPRGTNPDGYANDIPGRLFDAFNRWQEVLANRVHDEEVRQAFVAADLAGRGGRIQHARPDRDALEALYRETQQAILDLRHVILRATSP